MMYWILASIGLFVFLTPTLAQFTSGPKDLEMSLKCDADSMRLKVPKRVLDELGINASLLHMSNPECKMQDTMDLHVSAILTRDNHTLCGTQVTVNGSHLIYSNELTTETSLGQGQEASGRLISRSSDVRIKFSCVYDFQSVVSLPYQLLTIASMVTFMVKEGMFNVTMTLHPTSEFLDTYEKSPIIPLSHRFYTRLQIYGHTVETFRLKLEECWATPSANHSDKIRHPIIINGKANDSTVEILSTKDYSLACFSMQMFHFINYTDVYLHCRIWLCHINNTHCSDKDKSSNGRYTRALSDPYRKIVSYGPIKLTKIASSTIEKSDSGTVWKYYLAYTTRNLGSWFNDFGAPCSFYCQSIDENSASEEMTSTAVIS
ncbi:uromodulin-like [Bombina bombina]|uniref:uromodulin-like n=1 Tax=Bombina bombina TaxID=8345 RepID=UPI00235B062E|nr:uromodulin-like [Bombina bombina]